MQLVYCLAAQVMVLVKKKSWNLFQHGYALTVHE